MSDGAEETQLWPGQERAPEAEAEAEPAVEPDEDLPAEEDELPRPAATEHADGGFSIPDGYGVIEGEATGARRSAWIRPIRSDPRANRAALPAEEHDEERPAEQRGDSADRDLLGTDRGSGHQIGHDHERGPTKHRRREFKGSRTRRPFWTTIANPSRTCRCGFCQSAPGSRAQTRTNT